MNTNNETPQWQRDLARQLYLNVPVPGIYTEEQREEQLLAIIAKHAPAPRPIGSLSPEEAEAMVDKFRQPAPAEIGTPEQKQTTESILRKYGVWSQDLEVSLLRYWCDKEPAQAVAELQQQFAAWQDRMKAVTGEDSPDSAGNVVIALKTHLAEAEQDGARLDWLCSPDGLEWAYWESEHGKTALTRQAIDAARSAQENGK